MRYRVLSVLPNPEQYELVQETLRELTDISFDFIYTTNEAKAREKLSSGDGGYDLVVTSLDIPEDSKTMPVEGLRLGLGLAQWINEKMNIPTILFTIVDDADLNKKVNQLGWCELVTQKLGWEDLFKKRVRQGLEGRKVPEEKRLNVDIFLNLGTKTPEYALGGVGFPCSIEHKTLDILTTEFLELIKESSALAENCKGKREWQSKLQHIGEKLMAHIFERDRKFSRLFTQQVTLAGGLPNTRIRFVVGKEVHPIALEAIYGPHEQLEEDYWMLHAPIYRTVGESGGWGNPLFHDQETKKGPLSILIIESPTEGEAVIKEEGMLVRNLKLERLQNVKAECGFLKNFSDSPEYSGRVRIGKVEVIPRPGDDRPFVEQVQDTLEQGKRVWHIVHYAGHSYFDSRTNKGYVFFPSVRDGEPAIEVVDLDLLSVWMRPSKTNLVFLSSCHSSEVGFVFALAKKQIPATVGFRWDVEDDKAAEYTRAFYRVLFGGEMQSLEDVFLKARQNIYKQYKDNPIWAAPALVMQIPSR
jgi:hypothetical protein